MSHIPMSRAGIKDWCMKSFARGMTAQSDYGPGTPQEVFETWWECLAGPDPKPRRAKRGDG